MLLEKLSSMYIGGCKDTEKRREKNSGLRNIFGLRWSGLVNELATYDVIRTT